MFENSDFLFVVSPLLALFPSLIWIQILGGSSQRWKSWIQKVCAFPSCLLAPSHCLSLSVGSPGVSKNALTVGASAYDHEVLVYFSSIGYDYDNHLIKPNVVTPGQNLLSTGESCRDPLCRSSLQPFCLLRCQA
jgi:hypothetical protein